MVRLVAYCVAELGHSDSEAYTRIGVARLARRFPVIFELIADGRQTLTSVKLLSRHLTPETADDLLETSAHMSKSQIQHLLAQRFPNPWFDNQMSGRLVPERVGMWVETEIAPGVFELRAVYERDGGKCTYVAADGRRCGSAWQVEFDHSEAFANGGEATVDDIRLLCRAHNQYMAECTFGPGFMREKRRAAAEAREAAKSKPENPKPQHDQVTLDVIAGLKQLGCRAEQARAAAEYSATQPHASLEERFKIALRWFSPRGTKILAAPQSAA